MGEPIVYVKGEYVPESQAKVSVFDRGYTLGDGVYDVIRSFGHRPHKVPEHCERLLRSARYCRIRLELSAAEVEKIVLEVFDRNKGLLGPNDDYMIMILVSRGVDPPSRNPVEAGEPTLVVYTYAPPYRRFAKFFRLGAHVVTPSTRRTPAQCLEPKAKITNKMNHILAELEAKSVDPEAFPLMLDLTGHIAESSSSNFFFVRSGSVFTPRGGILLGIMRSSVFEAGTKAGIKIHEGDFSPYDVYCADEAFLTTTSFCILPVSQFNGTALPSKIPGPMTTRLLDTWNRMVGIDVAEQYLSHLSPAERAALP